MFHGLLPTKSPPFGGLATHGVADDGNWLVRAPPNLRQHSMAAQVDVDDPLFALPDPLLAAPGIDLHRLAIKSGVNWAASRSKTSACGERGYVALTGRHVGIRFTTDT